MIVNLYVDHLASTPPASAEEVWNDTREHAKLFSDAAARIGMTPSEYREFRANLLDGKARYVTLPRRLDAMSGNRRGSVYAVHNAYLTTPVEGWRVALADGNVVYVPRVCGNISLLKHAAIAQAPAPKAVAVAKHAPKFTPAVGALHAVPPTQVAVVPPEQDVPVDAPPVVAPVVPAAIAAGGPSPFLLFIPAALGGLAASSHGSSPHPGAASVPACSAGSNSTGVCFSIR